MLARCEGNINFSLEQLIAGLVGKIPLVPLGDRGRQIDTCSQKRTTGLMELALRKGFRVDMQPSQHMMRRFRSKHRFISPQVLPSFFGNTFPRGDPALADLLSNAGATHSSRG